MRILRQKIFSLFGMNMLDFLKEVENSNYSNKNKELQDNTIGWYSTYEVFEKGITYKNSSNIKDILKNLESKISEVLRKNNLGTSKDWSLYVVYLEKQGNNLFISFGLENPKRKDKNKALSFSLKI